MVGDSKKKHTSRGRPRKSEITKFKVMTWFNAVALASGKTSAELEREFAGQGQVRRVKGREVRPKLWEKYRRGDVEPRVVPSKGKSISIVQQVERVYPGTSRWLNFPLWRLLEAEHLKLNDLLDVFRGLEDSVRNQLLYQKVPEGGIFWEKSCRDTKHLVGALFNLKSPDATTALIALIRQAEICQDQLLHEEAYWALITILEDLRCDPPLERVLPKLRLYLIQKFTNIYYSQDGKSWCRRCFDPDQRGKYQAMLTERKGNAQMDLFSSTAA